MQRRTATSDNRNKPRSVFVPAMALLIAAAPGAHALEQTEADRLVQARVASSPGDDIESGFRALHVEPVDLDGDGVDEVLYAETATCRGAARDCTNGIRVLAGSDAGYGPAGAAFIPGEMWRIRVDGPTVAVDFEVPDNSSICHQGAATDGSLRCPPPGRYRWHFRWTRDDGLGPVGAGVDAGSAPRLAQERDGSVRP